MWNNIFIMWTQIQIRAEQTHIVWNELIIYYIKNILTSGTNIDVTEKKTSENTKKTKNMNYIHIN